jgi:DNA repair exonuclease SbcCD ATPase subunit
MLKLNSIRLKGPLLFKDVKFDFKPGVSAIYGLNLAGGKSKSNGNGAGKSAFFSQVGEILFDEPMVGTKQDALKTGTRLLNVTAGDTTFNIQRSGTGLKIMKGGKSRFRTKPMARKWLDKKLPISIEDFNTYVHSDARVPHPLVMGNSTARKKFFTSFFGLDKIDTERRLFLAELSKLAKVRAAFTELKAEYSRAKDKVDGLDLRELKAKVAATAEELEALHEKSTRLQDICRLLAFEKSAAAQIAEFSRIAGDISVDSFDELMTTAKWNLRTNKKDLEEARAWEQHQKDTRRYDKALASLGKDAAKLVAKHGVRKATKLCKTFYADRRGLEEQWHTADQNFKWATKIVASGKPEAVDELKTSRKELKSRIESLEHQYDHAKKFKTGQCETCGQDVTVKSPKKLRHKIETLEAEVEACDAYAEYETAIEEYKKARKELKESEIDALNAAMDKSTRYMEAFDEIKNLPDEPEKFEGKKLEVQVLERMVTEDRDRISLLTFIHPNLETIIDLGKLTAKQRGAASIGPKLQAKINELQDKLSNLKTKYAIGREAMQTYKRLKERLTEMREELKDEEALKLLVDGYSDKAVKKMAIQAISKRLMVEVNKYARVVFPEDFEFSFSWDRSQISLVVTRKHGKKMLTSDVRKLSGAESKLFTLVLMAALMTFRPVSQRCNVLFLDEPTANFSPETTESFKRLIPVLNKIFPTIIIITPDSGERYEGAEEWTVVKTKVEAKLVKGHPQSVKL